jgi:hypothetical protein
MEIMEMSSDFTTVSVHNGGAFVISLFVTATAEDQPWSVKSGNLASDVDHSLEVPVDATDIKVEVHGEAFIDDWKTIYSNTWADTSSWPATGLSLTTSGTAFKMHCELNSGS